MTYQPWKGRSEAQCQDCGDIVWVSDVGQNAGEVQAQLDYCHQICEPNKDWSPLVPSKQPKLPPVPADCQYQGAVRQWRIWKYDATHASSNSLKALTQSHWWIPGVNTCQTIQGANDGFYGFSDYDQFDSQEREKRNAAMRSGPGSGYVLGSILCFGRIKVGQYGARAQYAIPEYLIAPEDADAALKLFEIAEFYGCKVVSDEQARGLKTGLVPYRRPVSLEDLLDG